MELLEIHDLNELFNEQARGVYFTSVLFLHTKLFLFEEKVGLNVGDLWQVKVLGSGASVACNANGWTTVK